MRITEFAFWLILIVGKFGIFFYIFIRPNCPLLLFHRFVCVGAVGRGEEEDLRVHQARGDPPLRGQRRGMQTSLVPLVRQPDRQIENIEMYFT